MKTKCNEILFNYVSFYINTSSLCMNVMMNDHGMNSCMLADGDTLPDLTKRLLKIPFFFIISSMPDEPKKAKIPQLLAIVSI